MSDGVNNPGEALNLPEPQTDASPYRVENQGVNEVMSELTGAKNTELATSVVVPTITPPASSLTPATPAVNVPTPTITDGKPLKTVADPSKPLAMPQIADDEDLIEKEWVDKAKQIVERTKTDPHSQNQEIGLYKAEYIKKRFNKDIKTTAEG